MSTSEVISFQGYRNNPTLKQATTRLDSGSQRLDTPEFAV